MPADKHLAVTEDTHGDIESLSRKLGVEYDEDFTQEKTVRWLLEHAPEPADANEDTDE